MNNALNQHNVNDEMNIGWGLRTKCTEGSVYLEFKRRL